MNFSVYWIQLFSQFTRGWEPGEEGHPENVSLPSLLPHHAFHNLGPEEPVHTKKWAAPGRAPDQMIL